VDQREEFVLAHLRGERTMTQLCRDFGVSRKTGYKWVERFFESGAPGLADLSRAPVRRPHALDDTLAETIVELRKKHPTWGPKKLLAYLSRKHPKREWPAQSTIGALLKRRGSCLGEQLVPGLLVPRPCLGEQLVLGLLVPRRIR
jgi:putative transposase